VQRLGILGGTFNPPHLGHLAVARHARDELGLDLVVLMPAHIPPHKPVAEDPGPKHRLRMCRMLVADAGGLSTCAQEIERGGESYTVDTLQAIHAGHADVRLTFILGADTASALPAWREPAKLLELADLAVAARSGSAWPQVLEMLAALKAAPGDGVRGHHLATEGEAAGVRFLHMPLMEISSSMVRRCAARGEPIEDLVGPSVARYIAEHGLYRPQSEAES
jgi:nicotinate-nucleotide adenylyltransferase